MLLLVFIVLWIALSGWAHLAKGGRTPPVRTAPVPADADRVQDRWTSLDDRQVIRLLDDSAPC